jgi:hypothetical protein
MPIRCYDITTHHDIVHIAFTIKDQESDCVIAEGFANDRTIPHTLARIVLTDFLKTIEPEGHNASACNARQVDAIARLIGRRLRQQPHHATISATEISSKLLNAFIAPTSGPWVARYSVPRSSGAGAWTVAKDAKGAWGCSCPRWRFKREQCKHIETVITLPHHYPYLPADE